MFQEKEKYFNWLKIELENYFKDMPSVQVFLFGGALRHKKFNDVDVAIGGKIDDGDVIRLKALFEASTFPYVVDVINFNRASDKFKHNVMNHPIIWIKR